MREAEGTADRRHWRSLIAGCAGREPASGDVGRRGGRVVAQRLLLLHDVSEAEINSILLVKDVIHPDSPVGNSLLEFVRVIDIGVNQRVVYTLRQGRRRIHRFCKWADATERDLVVGKRKARVVIQGSLGGAGVVELLKNAGPIYQSAEIPVSHGRGGHPH